MKRFDERDVMFSRMSYKKGSKEYKDYYENNPDKKELDDQLREMPGLLSEGSATFDPVNAPMINSAFKFLSDIHHLADGKPGPEKIDTDPAVITKKLKGLAKEYGAGLVGITGLTEDLYYSHRGRKAEHYGQKIDEYHKYAVVFAVEMEEDTINRAPALGAALETTKGYVQGAMIGMILSYAIRELGYPARNHMDGNYLLPGTFVAEKAGLGEIGRMGLLITKEYGPRIRLGIVTTDLELVPDERVDFGLKDFCLVCKKCIRTCPGKSINDGPGEIIEGIRRWKNDPESCFKVWQNIGTDCGICLTSCPLSHNVSSELLENMKDDKRIMKKILEEHEEKYKLRPFNNSPHNWL